MDFRIYYLNLTLEAINESISKGNMIIDVKKVRRYHNIPQFDKSKINFIWRSLEFLEQQGLITRYLNKTPKSYKLPRQEIKIKNIIGDTIGDTGIT